MKLEINYLKKADKFLKYNNNLLSKDKVRDLIIKAAKRIIFKEDINIDLKNLKGNLKDYYRIRHGKIRILFKIDGDKIIVKIIVNDIDFRGDVYK